MEYNMTEKGTFSYWKKPYQKWVLLFGASLLSISLWLRVKDFVTISNLDIRTKIFSQSGWESYLLQQYFQFAISVFLISLFFGSFIIGSFATSSKIARTSEGILMISLAFLWCIIGLLIGVSNDIITLVIWIIILIATLLGGIYSFKKGRRCE